MQYCTLLIEYFSNSYLASLFNRITDILNISQQQRHHDIIKMFKAIHYRGTTPLSISDFMAIDVTMRFEDLQKDLINEYVSQGSLDGNKL